MCESKGFKVFGALILSVLLLLNAVVRAAVPEGSEAQAGLRERLFRLSTTQTRIDRAEMERLYQLGRELRASGFVGPIEVLLPEVPTYDIPKILVEAVRLWGVPTAVDEERLILGRALYRWADAKFQLRFGSAEYGAPRAKFALILNDGGPLKKAQRPLWKDVHASRWYVIPALKPNFANQPLKIFQRNSVIYQWIEHTVPRGELEFEEPMTFEDLANLEGEFPFLGDASLPENWRILAKSLSRRTVILTDFSQPEDLARAFTLFRYMQLRRSEYQGFQRPVLMINLSSLFQFRFETPVDHLRVLNERLVRINRDLMEALPEAQRPLESLDRRADVAALDIHEELLPAWTRSAQVIEDTEGKNLRLRGMARDQFLILQAADLPVQIKEALLGKSRFWALLSKSSGLRDYARAQGIPHFLVNESRLEDRPLNQPVINSFRTQFLPLLPEDLQQRFLDAEQAFQSWDQIRPENVGQFGALPLLATTKTKAKLWTRAFAAWWKMDDSFSRYAKDQVAWLAQRTDCRRSLSADKLWY